MSGSIDTIKVFFALVEAGFASIQDIEKKVYLNTLDLEDNDVWCLDFTSREGSFENSYRRDLQTTVTEIDQWILRGNARLELPDSVLNGNYGKASTYLGLACAMLLHYIHMGEDERAIVSDIQEYLRRATQLFTACGKGTHALWSSFVANIADILTQSITAREANARGVTFGSHFSENNGPGATAANICSRLVRRLKNDTSGLYASRDLDALMRLLYFNAGFCEAASLTISLAQSYTAIARLHTDVNDTMVALDHLNRAYDLAIKKDDHRIEINSYKGLVDRALDGYMLINDEDGLSEFYRKLENTWLVRFTKPEEGLVPLQRWRRQQGYWFEKITFRNAIRGNQSYHSQKQVAKRLSEPLPEDIEIAAQELWYRSNLGMNYGHLDAARDACERLDAEPYDYFSRVGRWTESPEGAWIAFEACIERTAFQNSLRFFEKLQQFPEFLSLPTLSSQHETKEYRKLVRVARLYIFQERWEDAFNLLVCSCSLISEERQKISSVYLRSRHFDHTIIEKAFDWIVWVRLHFHATPDSPNPRALDSRTLSNDWAQEALRYAEMGRARRVGDILQKQNSDRLGAFDTKNALSVLADTNTAQDLSTWLDPETVVVYTTLCEEGLGLICCSADGILHAEWLQGLPGFGRWKVSQLTSIMYMVFSRIESGSLGWEKQNSTEQRRIREAVSELSSSIISPIKNILLEREPKRICFVPAAQLLRVPFASLEIDTAPLITRFTVYQAPSLTILKSLCDTSRTKLAEIKNVSVVVRASYEQVTILENAVECVDAVDQVGSVGELKSALGLSKHDFLQSFRLCDILHIGCHGDMDYEKPEKSHISLEQDVTVADMEQITSVSKLVYFSACLTGLGHSSLTDDLTGFQAQVLQSGASAFAGLIWNGNALASLFFSHFFYEHLAASRDATENLADIFSGAQRRLRNLRSDEAQKIIETMKDRWDEHEATADLPQDIAELGRQFFDCYSLRARASFEHMYFWAPFTFVGHPMPVCHSIAAH